LKYTPLSNRLFKTNRNNFCNQLQPKSIAVFNSNDIYPVSADSTLPFQQHRDLYYLSGLDQEESILVLFPDAKNKAHREIAFVKKTNAHIAVWEGHKLTKAEVTERSGITTVYWLEDFEGVFFKLMAEAETIYFNTNEHSRAASEVQTREDRFISYCTQKFPAHRVAKSAPILHQLRSIKQPEEIQAIQEACAITEKGFRMVLPIPQLLLAVLMLIFYIISKIISNVRREN